MKNNFINCERCEESLYDSQLLRYKDGSLCFVCKNCINKEIFENGKLAVQEWAKKFDILFIEKEWEYTKRYGEGLFSKYYALMKLPAFRKFNYEDSNKINQKEDINNEKN